MRVIDSQGRLLGRWNLIDVAVAVAVVIVVVLGYGAFLLFRTPVPIVASITPTQIFAQQEGTLLVAGEHLRPFLSARLDCGEREEACDSVVTPLLVPSPSSAEVNLTNLSAGTYDFVLLDEARELVRIPEAITVLPFARLALAEMDIQAVGAFVFLSSADVAAIEPGVSLNEELDLLDLAGRLNGVAGQPDIESPMGQVLAIKPAETGTQQVRVSDGTFVEAPVTGKLQVPAILRLRCLIVTDRCTISGVPALKGALVPLAEWVPEHEKFERPVTHFVFRVDDLRPATTPPTFVTAPVPIVASITPTQIFAQQEGTLLVAGEHFSPFLSARLDCGEREEVCDSVVTPLLVPSPSSAEVNLTNLSAGTYDFVLLDEARELVRIPEAITVLPLTRSALAEMDIQAVGAFVFLSSADAAAITTGLSLNEELDLLDLEGRLNNVRLDALNARHLRRQLTGEPDIDGPMGRVLAIKPAEPGTQLLRVSEGDLELMESEGLRYMVRDFDTLRQRSVEVANDRLGNTVEALVTGKLQVPAILRLRCLIVAGRCTISGIPALKGALVPLAEWMPEHEKFERSVTHFVFRVDDLRPTTTPPTFVTADVELINAVVRVRFLASSEVAALPRVGDEDARVPVVLDTMVVTARHDGRNPRAAMTAVDAERRQVVTTTEFEGPLAPLRSWEKLGTMQPQRTSFQETMAMFEATLNVPVTQTSAGWQYAGQTVKVGSSFQFEGPTYAMGGWVIDMQLADETRTEN